jgi:hypothetical protein
MRIQEPGKWVRDLVLSYIVADNPKKNNGRFS